MKNSWENAVEAVSCLCNVVNNYGGKEEAEYIVDELLKTHPTIQQQIFGRIIAPFILKLGERHKDIGEFNDPRNYGATKQAKIMANALKSQARHAFNEAGKYRGLAIA